MKKKIIIANWKENPSTLETAEKLLKISSDFPNNSFAIVHAVPNIFAGVFKKEKKSQNIILQNISVHNSGSHTGEISAEQAKNLNIEMSIVGHSETRLSPENPHGDEDKDVNMKVKNLLTQDMGVVLCVGEYIRDENYKNYLKTQIENCLSDIQNTEKIIIAYEPVWAIGEHAKRPATQEEIVETIAYIKSILPDTPVLYGGSVDEKNVKGIIDLDIVDGLLVGRASSDETKWKNLLEKISGIKKIKNMSDLDITEGNRVLLRLDLNVPTDDSGNITNTFRIDESLPTIIELQKKGAKIIIVAHKEEGTLKKIGDYLKEKVANFQFISLTDVFDKNGMMLQSFVEKVNTSPSSSVLLLDNIRLDKREKNKDSAERDVLGKELSKLGDYYINEAFSAAHRDHASITSIPKYYTTDKKCLGPKFVQEIEKLSLAIVPKHPMLLLVGGAKFDTKLAMLEKFLNVADKIFVGGALAHSFWKEKGYKLGTSLVDDEVKLSEKVLRSEKIILPLDVMVEDRSEKQPSEIGDNEKIVDFGKKTLSEILDIADSSNTIVWNGPVDWYEKGYDWGTKELIENFSKMTDKTIILGGGDTVTEIDRVKKENPNIAFTHVSTGGGAMIDFLSNGTLPGIESIVN